MGIQTDTSGLVHVGIQTETSGPLKEAGRCFVTTETLAERWHTTPKGVAELRHRGQGPRGHRIGRRILYLLEDVETWEAERADPRPAS